MDLLRWILDFRIDWFFWSFAWVVLVLMAVVFFFVLNPI